MTSHGSVRHSHAIRRCVGTPLQSQLNSVPENGGEFSLFQPFPAAPGTEKPPLNPHPPFNSLSNTCIAYSSLFFSLPQRFRPLPPNASPARRAKHLQGIRRLGRRVHSFQSRLVQGRCQRPGNRRHPASQSRLPPAIAFFGSAPPFCRVHLWTKLVESGIVDSPATTPLKIRLSIPVKLLQQIPNGILAALP